MLSLKTKSDPERCAYCHSDDLSDALCLCKGSHAECVAEHGSCIACGRCEFRTGAEFLPFVMLEHLLGARRRVHLATNKWLQKCNLLSVGLVSFISLIVLATALT